MAEENPPTPVPRYHPEVTALCAREGLRVVSLEFLMQLIEELDYRVKDDDGVTITILNWKTSGEQA